MTMNAVGPQESDPLALANESFRPGPNPWEAGKNAGGIRFFGTSPDRGVDIFTLSGQLVRRVRSSGGGQVEWDLKEEDGRDVASGYYLYRATTYAGENKTGTVAVIR
jgi:hypothetical protein